MTRAELSAFSTASLPRVRGAAHICDFCERPIEARYSSRQLEIARVGLPYLMCEKCGEACPWPSRDQMYAAIVRRAKRHGRKWGNAVAAFLGAGGKS